MYGLTSWRAWRRLQVEPITIDCLYHCRGGRLVYGIWTSRELHLRQWGNLQLPRGHHSVVPIPSFAGTKVLCVTLFTCRLAATDRGAMPTGRLAATPWMGARDPIAGIAGPWYRLPWAKGIVGFKSCWGTQSPPYGCCSWSNLNRV